MYKYERREKEIGPQEETPSCGEALAAVKRARLNRALRALAEQKRLRALNPDKRRRRRNPFEALVARGGLSERALKAAEEIDMIHAVDASGLYQLAAELGTVIQSGTAGREANFKRLQALRLRYQPWRDALMRGTSSLGASGPAAYRITVGIVAYGVPLFMLERAAHVRNGTGSALVATSLDVYGAIAEW